MHAARQLTVHARSTVPLPLAIVLDVSNFARCGVWRGITCGGALAFATSFHHVLDVHGQGSRDMSQRVLRELLQFHEVLTMRACFEAHQQFSVNLVVAASLCVPENPKRSRSRCGTNPADSSQRIAVGITTSGAQNEQLRNCSPSLSVIAHLFATSTRPLHRANNGREVCDHFLMVWRFPDVFYTFSRDEHGFTSFHRVPHGRCGLEANSNEMQKERHAARFEPRWLRLGYRNDSLHVHGRPKSQVELAKE